MSTRWAWKGRRFVPGAASSKSVTVWVSEAVGEYGRPIWKVRQFGQQIWYARLRLGPIRLSAEGKTAAAALDAVAAEASRVAGLLVDVGCGPDAL